MYNILGILVSGLIVGSCAGNNISSDKVPSVVLNSLKAKYPFANEIDWEKQNDMYEAELDLNDSTEVTIQIDSSGKILMLKKDISISEMPSRIVAVIKNQFAGYAADDQEMLEINGSVYYQVELDSNSQKELNLVFLPDGNQAKNIPYWD